MKKCKNNQLPTILLVSTKVWELGPEPKKISKGVQGTHFVFEAIRFESESMNCRLKVLEVDRGIEAVHGDENDTVLLIIIYNNTKVWWHAIKIGNYLEMVNPELNASLSEMAPERFYWLWK